MKPGSNGMVRPRRTGNKTELLVNKPTDMKYSRSLSAGDKYKGNSGIRNSQLLKCLSKWMPGSAEHLAFKKRVAITKRSSTFGLIWDISQVLFSMLACALYISETYMATYVAVQVYNYSELIVTQFFLIDFLFNWFVAPKTSQ